MGNEEKTDSEIIYTPVQQLLREAFNEGKVEAYNDIRDQLLGLPESIKSQSLYINEQTILIETLRRSIENSKNQAFELVLSATEEGKPKYTNDKARNIAAQQILRDDKKYLENLDELGRKEVQLRRDQIQLEYLQNMFRAHQAVAGMQGVR
jgi:hypothetical protein